MIDCTACRTDPCFMKRGNPNQQYGNIYNYGLTTSRSEHLNNGIPVPVNQFATQPFASGHCYMKIINNAGNNLKVEIYDKNKTTCKFVNYNAVFKPVPGTTCKISQFADQETLPQYISGYCYFAIKIGGVVINPNLTLQTITTGGRQYRVRFETRNFGGDQPQACANSNYYFLSITPV